MFGWLIVVSLLSIIAAPNDPNQETPVQVGLGVVVTPADGWYSAADVWDVGPDALSLQKAGSFVAFSAEGSGAGNQQLLDGQLAVLERDFESYRALPPSDVTVADGLPGLVALFTGVANSRRMEGEVVAVSSGGVGVVMLAIAPQGQLSRVQGDLDAMLRTLEVPR